MIDRNRVSRVTVNLGVAVLTLAGLWGQKPYDINRYIENPNMFSEGQESPHVAVIPFSTRDAALAGKRDDSEDFLSLDGTWQFRWYPRPDEVIEEFVENEFSASGWDRIEVPGTWQMQGYDHVIYRNVGEDFTPWDPPRVPDLYNPVGCYLRTFDLPQSWNGKHVLLHFEGVKSAYFVWLNGRYVGYDQGSMTPGEFDVTRFLNPGSNRLAVKVIRWSDGSYLEDQDMWRFSGIYRSVYLYARKDTHIRDFFVTTDLDEEYLDAVLKIDVSLRNAASAPGSYRVRAELVGPSGEKTLELQSSLTVPAGRGNIPVSLSGPVSAPLKWSSEKPHLYRLLVFLEDGDGSIVEIVSTRVGFREVAVRDRQVLVNGVAVEFKGVNKHEHHPQSGRTMKRETMIRDLELMKQFNVNAVRLSHYPNDPEWYDLADEYGIYVVDEVNAECHGDESLSEDPVWAKAFVDRFGRMLERDKNHPSIVMWSTGNECGLGVGTVAMARYAQQRDRSRLLFAQGNPRGGRLPNGDAPFADVNGIRYPSPSELRDHARTCPKPVVMGEYSHALANSCGHLDEYWDLIFEQPTLQGGFIWDWVDQALEHELFTVADRSGNGNFGAFLGRPRLVPGRSGQAVELSGIDDWVEVYTGPSLDLVEAMTLDLWIYPREWHGHNPILSRSNHFTLEQSARDKLQFAVFTPEKLAVEVSLPTDWQYNWHRLTASFDGREIRLGVDEEVEQMRLPDELPLGLGVTLPLEGRTMAPSQYPLNVGRNWWENHENYRGWISNSLIDEVRIFKQAFTARELDTGQGQSAGDLVLYLDFDSVERGENFLSYGATPWASGTLDGIIFADRTPQPELWQVKRSQAPVRVEPIDLRAGRFRVSNRFDFTDLNELEIAWKLLADGEVLSEELLQLALPPQQSREVSIALPRVRPRPGWRYWLELQFRSRRSWPGLPAGHEVAFAQFELPWLRIEAEAGQVQGSPLSVSDPEGRVAVAGREFQVDFDPAAGRIVRYRFRDTELLKAGPQLNIWRPPILNEMSIWNEAESQPWYSLGLNRLRHDVLGVEVRGNTPERVEVVVRTRSAPEGQSHGFENEYLYEILRDGSIVLTHRAVPFGDLPWFQKLGLDLEIPAGCDRVHWYGRGPFENYPDRKSGARVGIYSLNPAEDYVPYVYPQDYGNRSDVHWVAVEDGSGVGLMVLAESPASFSVDPWENLEKSVYAFQLREKDGITLHLDHQVTGVGGTPVNVRPRYRTYPREYQYRVLLRPFAGGLEEAKQVGRMGWPGTRIQD